MRTVVSECGHRFEVVPEAQRHGDLVALKLGIALRQNAFAPGMLPGLDIADRARMEPNASVGGVIHTGNPIDETLDARTAYEFVENSDGKESDLVRHERKHIGSVRSRATEKRRSLVQANSVRAHGPSVY